jgi:DNA polymerase I-like protein with 3'-5' exonuclease and polymerase domains
MDLITLDFETFYDPTYSLRKITTEEYIRSPLFEVIGVSVKVNDGEPEWASGSHKQLKDYLHSFDWANSMTLAHNNAFDGAILSWIFDIHPKVLADTLCMARALHGVEVGGSLAALAKSYGLSAKGTEVVDAIGLRRSDFSDRQLSDYGDYCINDVEICYALFLEFLEQKFPKSEMKIIDVTLRMFTEPVLELNKELLQKHLSEVQYKKELLMEKAGAKRDDLMSNAKFADMLRALDVIPPTKISLRTDKKTYAFAKADKAFTALLDHANPEVQVLMAARLGNKSTIEETRTERFIDISKRGALAVPIKYYAAHTGRFGGFDKINLQNLPNRTEDKTLKRSICAPEGYVIIDCDSSQIEARVLAWFAGQEDLVTAFANGEDVYKKMAAEIYDVDMEEVSKDQRFVGKQTILGSGYSMGPPRFQEQLRVAGVDIAMKEACRINSIYRDTNWNIVNLWAKAGYALTEMFVGNDVTLGPNGLLKAIPSAESTLLKNCGFTLPSGLQLRYDGMEVEEGERGPQFTYKMRNGRAKIYGGKVVENICQALARAIITEQMLLINKKYRPVLTVHDSVAAVVPIEEKKQGQKFIEQCMRTVPKWAEGVPLACESGFADNYGDAG